MVTFCDAINLVMLPGIHIPVKNPCIRSLQKHTQLCKKTNGLEVLGRSRIP